MTENPMVVLRIIEKQGWLFVQKGGKRLAICSETYQKQLPLTLADKSDRQNSGQISPSASGGV